MATVRKVSSDGDCARFQVDYRDSNLFDCWHYIHKYYLSPGDKGSLFPVDIHALEFLFHYREESGIEEPFDFRDGIIPGTLPYVMIHYRELKLEKRLDVDLVRRGLTAIAAYKQEITRELTTEEERAALNLNEWLGCYEKSLAVRYIEIVNGMNEGLRESDPLLVDYEIDLEMQFYLLEDDQFYDNDAADEHDWEVDAALMCELKPLTTPHRLNKFHDPEYFGLGDDRDHNEAGPWLRRSHRAGQALLSVPHVDSTLRRPLGSSETDRHDLDGLPGHQSDRSDDRPDW